MSVLLCFLTLADEAGLRGMLGSQLCRDVMTRNEREGEDFLQARDPLLSLFYYSETQPIEHTQ